MRARTRFVTCLLGTLAVAAGPVASAAALEVTVLDHSGKPVADAVVLLRSPRAGAPRVPASATVDQLGKQFKPWVQVVRVGGAVRFSNSDDITHHVYSFSPAKRFAYRLQAGETQGPLSFDAPGVVVLGCNIHDWMVGYVLVTDAPRALATGADGEARFPELGAGEWQASLWHPGLTDASAPPERTLVLAADDALRITLRLTAPLRETGPRRPLAGDAY